MGVLGSSTSECVAQADLAERIQDARLAGLVGLGGPDKGCVNDEGGGSGGGGGESARAWRQRDGEEAEAACTVPAELMRNPARRFGMSWEMLRRPGDQSAEARGGKRSTAVNERAPKLKREGTLRGSFACSVAGGVTRVGVAGWESMPCRKRLGPCSPLMAVAERGSESTRSCEAIAVRVFET